MDCDFHRRSAIIVALSAAIPCEQDQGADRSCFDRWLTKPVNQADLEALLGRVVRSSSFHEDGDARWAHPLARLGGRRQLFIQLAQTWSAGLPKTLEKLQTATKQNCADDVARLAHLISGQASIFDADELVSAARRVEECELANPVDRTLVAALEAQCWKLSAELEPWVYEEAMAAPP